MIRALQMLGELSAVGPVDFLSFSNHPSWPWKEVHVEQLRRDFPRVTLHLQRRTLADHLFSQVKSILVSVFPERASRIAALRLPFLQPAWNRVKGNSVVFINYLDGILQLNGVAVRGRLLVDTHDIAFLDAHARMGLPVYSVNIVRIFRREMALMTIPDDVIAISAKEYSFLDDIFRIKRLWLVPPRAPLVPATASTSPRSASLLFVGSASTKNARGVSNLIEQMHSWTARPPLIVAGNVCKTLSAEGMVTTAPGVQLVGFVDDLLDLYASVAAVVCPIVGTGINIKLLEALSHGVPVFATRSAIHALPPGYEGCVFELNEDSIVNFLASPARWLGASALARSYVHGPAFEAPTQQLRSEISKAHDTAPP